jgi:predicted dehydrogenase/putative sterol carrier protein
MINVGIIGCGRIADLHYLGYKDNPHARIHAVCDANPERAERRRMEWGAERAYTTCREMLLNPDIDAIEVITPIETHEKVVIDALKAEKHVAVQKPMALSLQSADRMLAAAGRIGKIFKVTECYVCWPPIVLAKRLIDEGRIGKPLGIRIKYICSPHGGWDVPPSTIQQQIDKAGQGFGLETFDHGHHEWATAWYLMGPVERVNAWIDSADGLLDCPATIMWKYREGKRYGIADFMFAPEMHMPTRYYPNDEWYEINGSRGILLVNRGTGNIREGPIVSLFDGHTWEHFDNVPSDWSEGFIGATRNFIAAIRGEQQPLLTGPQGREVLRFALAIARSARKRRDVYLDEMEAPLPSLTAWVRRRRERRDVIVGKKIRTGRRGFFVRASKYAPQAHALMEKVQERFDARAAEGWNCTLGVELTPDGGVEGEKFGLHIHDGKLDVIRDELPADAVLTLHIPAGTWAAILLGKMRLEAALLRGKIKYEGRAEEGLRLRSVLRL